MLGNGRLEAMCFDGQKRLCHIRGKLRKKVWINQSDIILVSNSARNGISAIALPYGVGTNFKCTFLVCVNLFLI